MTDEERLNKTDLLDGKSDDKEVIWAVNYLLGLPDDDDLPIFA